VSGFKIIKLVDFLAQLRDIFFKSENLQRQTLAEDDAQTRIVVLEEDGETIGLRVSAVEDVANLTDSQIEPPDTARICQISNDLFRGVARVSQRPMILLDATRLLS